MRAFYPVEDQSRVCYKHVEPRRGETFGDNRCRGKVVYVDPLGRGWCRRHEPDEEHKALFAKFAEMEKKREAGGLKDGYTCRCANGGKSR